VADDVAGMDLVWQEGRNFFFEYKLERVAGEEADEVYLFGQGGYGTVLGCEPVFPTTLPPPPLVVKRIDPLGASREQAMDLYNREVCTARAAKVAMARLGFDDFLVGILDGYMCFDQVTSRYPIFVVMERLPTAIPYSLSIPRGAPMPPPGCIADAPETFGSDVDLYDYVTGTPRNPPRRLSLFDARMVVKQLLTVLAALHERGYVHRDVKLDNVMIAGWETRSAVQYMRVKLGDFSLMRDYSDHTVAVTSTAGSRHFQPPEQQRVPLPPDFRYDGREDVFAVGCVWYACVTGNTHLTEEAAALRHPAVAALIRRPAEVADSDDVEARMYLDARFPIGFRNPDGTLTTDGVLLMAMTRRRRYQRCTAAAALTEAVIRDE